MAPVPADFELQANARGLRRRASRSAFDVEEASRDRYGKGLWETRLQRRTHMRAVRRRALASAKDVHVLRPVLPGTHAPCAGTPPGP
jgi:hypothetical protein